MMLSFIPACQRLAGLRVLICRPAGHFIPTLIGYGVQIMYPPPRFNCTNHLNPGGRIADVTSGYCSNYERPPRLVNELRTSV
jgi:hypothetical protein